MPKYRVLSRAPFMGCPPESVFEAKLDPEQEQRAIDRGAIEKVRADAKPVDKDADER